MVTAGKKNVVSGIKDCRPLQKFQTFINVLSFFRYGN